MAHVADIRSRYEAVRARTVALANHFTPDDQCVQSMPDASPTKWHLAHTTWFFERMVLAREVRGYVPVDPHYEFLFNSYYEAIGPRHPRPERGHITRPTLEEVHAYRKTIDARIRELPELRDPSVIELGLNHEEQHQELILTDGKNVLFESPFKPGYDPKEAKDARALPSLEFLGHDGGLVEIGAPGSSFAFDNESPRHRVWLEPFEIATRPVTQGEFAQFIADGGYETPSLWLSDGWEKRFRAPLYWVGEEAFTARGMEQRQPNDILCHVSYYEADAYARWANARLPTEAEWETLEPKLGCKGRVWEWTASPYAPYPRFRPLAGALGEYNGKFMCNQMVLRGGSSLTPPGHARPTYRNFFPPHARWQMTGVRLARWL